MSKIKLEQLLTRELELVNPAFRLEKIGAKWAGSVISETFRRKSDRQRQQMLWRVLQAELGEDAVKQVGTLLAYTPQEWNIDLPDVVKVKAS